MALPAPCAWVCIVQNVPVPHALAIDLAQWRSEGSPPREPTRWHRDSWHRRLPAHSALFESLPLLLDRDAVTVHAQDVSGPEAAIRAFVAAMVWGYGPSGYGPYRTNRVLESNPDAPRRLLDTAEAVRERGPLAGFDVLAAAPLKYLGVAFSTKYLYYCSRAVSHLHDGRTAPILDSVMSRWMSSHDGVTFALTHDRDGYRRYVTLLEQWGPCSTFARTSSKNASTSPPSANDHWRRPTRRAHSAQGTDAARRGPRRPRSRQRCAHRAR